MRLVGRIEEWNDDRGFGFVTPNGGGERAFVHIKAFDKRSRRPVGGDLISYEPEADTRRRLNAVRIRFVQIHPSVQDRDRSWFPRRIIAALFILVLAIAWFRGKVPLVVLLAYGIMSLITFFAYGLDKAAARADRWRTPESTLHLLELLWGWPGALVAQGAFRHKTRKLSFQIEFWLGLAINLLATAWLLHSGKAALANQWLVSVLSRIPIQ